MKSSTNSTPLTSFALGIQGPFGSLKTTTILKMFGNLPARPDGTPRKLYVYNLDMKLNGPLDYAKREIPNLDVLYDDPFTDDEGKIVPEELRYIRVTTCINKAVADPTIGAIFIDSCTQLTDIMKNEIMKLHKPKDGIFNQQCWGILGDTYTKFLVNLKACGKPIIFSVHEEVMFDAMNTATAKYAIAIPGGTKVKMPTLLTDVWRSEVEEVSGKLVQKLRLSPSTRFDLVNSLGMVGTFPIDEVIKKWKEVYLK